MNKCTGIDHRHNKWPLGQRVGTHINSWYVEGKVNKHGPELKHSCWVAFDVVVDKRDGNGARFCHIIPFRCMKKLHPIIPRTKKPWYKTGIYAASWRRG